jgi:hypothetical protein
MMIGRILLVLINLTSMFEVSSRHIDVVVGCLLATKTDDIVTLNVTVCRVCNAVLAERNLL